MLFKEHLTSKNIIFIFLVLLTIKFVSEIKTTAMLFFASYVVACSLNPVVDILEKKMKRYLAATTVLTLTSLVSFVFFVPIVFVATKQIQGFVNTMPQKLESIQNFISIHQFYGYKLTEIFKIESIIKSSSPFATGILNQSINITMGVFQGIMFFLAICMIVFYLLADKTAIQKGFIRVFPEKMKVKASEISENISKKVGGYVIAQILNMIAIGVLTAIGMFILKVDYALLLGLITGILDIIPIVGPTVALILCMLMAYQMGPVMLLLVFLMFMAAQWLSNNIIRPVVFGKFLNLHPLIIIFALLVGAQFLGVWGVILAPALAAIVCVLFDEIYLKTINKGSNVESKKH